MIKIIKGQFAGNHDTLMRCEAMPSKVSKSK